MMKKESVSLQQSSLYRKKECFQINENTLLLYYLICDVINQEQPQPYVMLHHLQMG